MRARIIAGTVALLFHIGAGAVPMLQAVEPTGDISRRGAERELQTTGRIEAHAAHPTPRRANPEKKADQLSSSSSPFSSSRVAEPGRGAERPALGTKPDSHGSAKRTAPGSGDEEEAEVSRNAKRSLGPASRGASRWALRYKGETPREWFYRVRPANAPGFKLQLFKNRWGLRGMRRPRGTPKMYSYSYSDWPLLYYLSFVTSRKPKTGYLGYQSRLHLQRGNIFINDLDRAPEYWRAPRWKILDAVLNAAYSKKVNFIAPQRHHNGQLRSEKLDLLKKVDTKRQKVVESRATNVDLLRLSESDSVLFAATGVRVIRDPNQTRVQYRRTVEAVYREFKKAGLL